MILVRRLQPKPEIANSSLRRGSDAVSHAVAVANLLTLSFFSPESDPNVSLCSQDHHHHHPPPPSRHNRDTSLQYVPLTSCKGGWR